MTIRFVLSVALVIALLLSAGSPAAAQPADTLLNGSFWKRQGLTDILPGWTKHARTQDGAFFAELDRQWTPEDSTAQYPGMLARHVFSYTAAYMMSGREAHIRHASDAVEILIDHGWDEQYGGWYNAVTRSGEIVDSDKDLFMQIYATTGLALYVIATRDSTAKTYLRRSREFMSEHAWDDAHGGYVDALNRDGSVKTGRKDFSPQLAPLSGYLLYLYSATRDSTYLREAERIMDLTLTHMQDDRGWILERFERDWSFLPNDPKNSHINVGHNLEVAWLLLRLYALTERDAYRRKGLALADQLLNEAFHEETGAWRADLRRTNPTQFPPTTTWWAHAYGNLLQLYAYRLTGNPRYLDAFRKGAEFWNDHFVDEEYGASPTRARLTGGIADGAKGKRTKTSYHSLEHALLCYLYLSLWVEDTSVTLHYRIAKPDGDRLYPLPIEDTTQRIRRTRINGTPHPSPHSSNGHLQLPEDGPVELEVELFTPSDRP